VRGTASSLRVALAPLDVNATFGVHCFGKYDATAFSNKGHFTKCFSVEGGVCVVRVDQVGRGVQVTVEGTGESLVRQALERSLAKNDGHDTFVPKHPLIAKLHMRLSGMRIIEVPWAFDVACQTVLGQRVTAEDAMREFRRIAERYGTKYQDLVAFPPASLVATMPTWQLEQLGIDPKRARAMVALAREVVRRPGFWASPLLPKVLASIRGIGPWTIGNIMGFAMGDPDALVLGDLHLPHVVTWALAEEPRGSDERMVELLQPFAGQRLTRLLTGSNIKVPR
jgi:endonuclease III